MLGSCHSGLWGINILSVRSNLQGGALAIQDQEVAMPALLCHKEPAQGKLKCRNIPDMGGIYCLMATYHAITTT